MFHRPAYKIHKQVQHGVMAKAADKEEQENRRLDPEKTSDIQQARGERIIQDVKPDTTDSSCTMAKLFPVVVNGIKQFIILMMLLFVMCFIPISHQDGKKTLSYTDKAIQTSTIWGKRRKKIERSFAETQAKYYLELTRAIKQRNNLLRKFKCKFRALVVEIEGKSKLATSVKNRTTKCHTENKAMRANILQMRKNLDRQRQQNKNVVERLENLYLHARNEVDEIAY